jgi:glycosyltransferase involved in cell wall biosynthesis
MPVSLMEAMNAGVLVISSNVGGVPYLVEDQKSGLLFDLDAKQLDAARLDSANLDAGCLAEKILWALEHQQESVAMIKAAHEEVKRYTWEEVRKLLLPLYEG